LALIETTAIVDRKATHETTHNLSRQAETWRAWLPAAAWLCVIFLFSTSYFSASETGAFIEPGLRWLLPAASAATITQLHFLIRKAAHFSEYLVLFSLLARGPMRARPYAALAACAMFAMLDEGHQSFVPSRTASMFDVGIDFSGALFAGCVRAAFLELI
jgi:VanZ family protein